MKRTILHIMTAVMMLVTFTACEKEAFQATFEGNGGKSIRILLNAQGDDVARAISRSAGSDTYGENNIKTADVFFYDANGNLLYDVPNDRVTLSAPDANGVVTATLPMPSGNINMNNAKVYVMGNRQATDEQVASAKASESALRALTFTTDDLAIVPTPQTTFAMDGTGDVTVNDNQISGHVELVRAAAKITLTVNIPETLVTNGVTYKPQINNVTVTFNKGVKTFGDKTKVFDVETRQGDPGTTDGAKTPVTFEPFYSYPTTWEAGDNNEPYFTLHVIWDEINAEGNVISYNTYHYRVPINKTHFETDGKTLALNRNHWYQVDLTVGVLGTPELSDLVEITGDYEVKPWGNLPIGADLLDYVYLIVDENNVTMSNINEVAVGYQASHDITAKITYISRPTFKNQSSIGEENFYDNNTGSEQVQGNLLKPCSVSVNSETGDIVLSHELVNTMPTSGTNFDYSVYTIKVLVTMTVGDKTYTETITYKQYPERYIEGEVSTGNVIVNGNKSGGSSWNVVQSGGGSNPINYIVNVTALEEGSNYVIGDPRVAEYSYLNYSSATTNGWTTAPAIYDGESDRQLLYYYPTKYEGDGVQNIIAPKFRVASSYGRKGGVTAWDQTYARYRCASYQENGYPAGRWRVPTAAEILYVSQLCNRGILGSIFDGGNGYWSATQVYNNGSLNNKTTASVRCVYDEWYWGSDKISNPSTFTWGDAPKQ